MSGFAFSDATLVALEQVQGRKSAGRGSIDHRGNRNLGRAMTGWLGSGFDESERMRRNARALDTLARTARKAPEVMVKLTGRQHEAGNVVANFTYIARLGHQEKDQVELLTSERQVLTDGVAMLELARSWHAWETADETRRKGSTSLSMVFSMPPGTDSLKLREAVVAFAGIEMRDRRWVLALHTDADHPHVHLTVARRNLDGTRFHPSREDFQRYRELFADLLVERGIDAAATPRRARGVVPKKDPIPVVKIREKGVEPRVDQLRRAGAEEAVRENFPPRELDGKATARVTLVRDVYMRAVNEIEARGNDQEKAVARSLRAFVAELPKPLSRMAAMIERIKEGRGLPQDSKPDVALERLKARVASREAGEQDGLAKLAAFVARLKEDNGLALSDVCQAVADQADAGKDRLVAAVARLKQSREAFKSLDPGGSQDRSGGAPSGRTNAPGLASAQDNLAAIDVSQDRLATAMVRLKRAQEKLKNPVIEEARPRPGDETSDQFKGPESSPVPEPSAASRRSSIADDRFLDRLVELAKERSREWGKDRTRDRNKDHDKDRGGPG